jgi:hypothetical protein
MIRTPSSSGRRRRLVPQAFATFVLIGAFAILVGLLTTGASVAATSQDKPANTKLPTITGSASENSRLHADPGTWTGDQPITFRFRWLRCSTTGGNCILIQNATSDDYTVRTSDVGHTLRVRVTASNDFGSATALSMRTEVVEAAPQQPSGRIQLPGGETSVTAASIPKDARMIVSQVRFEPNVITNRTQPITIHVRVTDTRGFVIRDALVFVRSTPRVTTGSRLQSGTDGWVTFQLQPLSTFPSKRGALQFFVKAFRNGDPPLAGVAGYRLVQVVIRPQ